MTRSSCGRYARFVPPPPGIELDSALLDWAQSIEGDGTRLDPVVAAAPAHYQFETLHLFNDGNGRIGRLVIVPQFLRPGIISEPLLTVSPWFEARRKDYQDNLMRVSETGDWDTWVSFFAEGIRAQAESTARKVTELVAFRAATRETVKTRSPGLTLDIVDDLVSYPVITAPGVAIRHSVSPQAAHVAVNKLVQQGVLQEVTGRNYGRVFCSREAMRILES